MAELTEPPRVELRFGLFDLLVYAVLGSALMLLGIAH
jgi:hypothetical protein